MKTGRDVLCDASHKIRKKPARGGRKRPQIYRNIPILAVAIDEMQEQIWVGNDHRSP